MFPKLGRILTTATNLNTLTGTSSSRANPSITAVERMTIDRLHKFLADSNKPKARPAKRDDEHRLQVACVRWFRYRYPNLAQRLFAVPNGGRRDSVTGAKLKAEGVLAGVADLILLKSNSSYGALLIEMKTKTGRQSTSQKEWQTDLCKYDEYRYVVCRSLYDFQKAVNSYLQ